MNMFYYVRKYSTSTSNNKEWVKPRIRSLYFYATNFSLEEFTTVILSNIKIGVSYSLLFKIKYSDNDGSQYGMISKQRPFKLEFIDKKSISILYDDIINLYYGFLERYNVDEVELIQVLYIVTKDIPELKLKNIKNIKLNKDIFKVGETKTKFSSKFLPLTTNLNYYGKFLLA